MPSWRAASMRLVPGATSISFPSMVSFGMGALPGHRRGRGASPGARAVGDQRLELVAELLDIGDVWPDGSVVEGADRGAGAALGHVKDRVEVFLAAVTGQDALAHLVDPTGGFATRRALAARLVGIEAGHHHERLGDGHRLVHHDDARRAGH